MHGAQSVCGLIRQGLIWLWWEGDRGAAQAQLGSMGERDTAQPWTGCMGWRGHGPVPTSPCRGSGYSLAPIWPWGGGRGSMSWPQSSDMGEQREGGMAWSWSSHTGKEDGMAQPWSGPAERRGHSLAVIWPYRAWELAARERVAVLPATEFPDW